MLLGSYKLKVAAKTWKRDSYGLFDYESTNCTYQDISIPNLGKLARVNHELKYINFTSQVDAPPTKDVSENPQPVAEDLVRILETNDGIKISTEASNRDSNQLWTVLHNNSAEKDCSLNVGDEVKFGRVRFKVTQIKVAQAKNHQKHNKRSIIDSLKEHMQMTQDALADYSAAKSVKSSTADGLCKICLCDKSEEENDPLISPCKCTGSVRFVHLKCMQNWVKSKLNMQQNKNIVTIFWKNLQCELCKTSLPINFDHHGQNLCLIPFDNKISGSYIMMESFSKEKNSTGIHIIDLSNNQHFKIGRGHDCDLKISDISVSRVHAIMVISKEKISLKDNNSKFGTLILRKAPIILNPENLKTQWFQCGRTLFRFTLKKPWLAYLPCIGSAFTSKNNQESNTTKTKNSQEEETMIRCASEEDLKKDFMLQN